MKIKFNILIISLLLSTFAFGQSASKKDIKNFCKSFETKILTNDLKGSLIFFEPEYKTTQHDNFLSSNTNQFIREFLAGTPRGEAIFKTPDINEIKSIKLKKIKREDSDGANAILCVKLKDGTILSSQVLIVTISKTEIYFVGAVG